MATRGARGWNSNAIRRILHQQLARQVKALRAERLRLVDALLAAQAAGRFATRPRET